MFSELNEDVVMYILTFHPVIAKKIGNVVIWNKLKEDCSDCAKTYFTLYTEDEAGRSFNKISWKKIYHSGNYGDGTRCGHCLMMHELSYEGPWN